MNKENCPVIIINSLQLSEMRLDALNGASGVIVEDLSYPERKTRGFMVYLDIPYLEEHLWFIPVESIIIE